MRTRASVATDALLASCSVPRRPSLSPRRTSPLRLTSRAFCPAPVRAATAGCSPHTIRVYSPWESASWPPLQLLEAICGMHGERAGCLKVMWSKEDGAAVRPATVNTYLAAVKSFPGFAPRVGFTRFNAGPLIKLKKAPRQIAHRILSEVEVAVLIRAAKTDRDRLMFDLAYFGGLRVSELVSLTWGQVIRRDSGEA